MTLDRLGGKAIGDDALVDDTGVVVREVRADDMVTALNAILDELRAIRIHLNQITEFEN